jgi:hypothetical protein
MTEKPLFEAIVYTPGSMSLCMIPVDGLKQMQQIVGGFIEQVPLTDGLVLICNEEGKINGLPVSWAAYIYDQAWEPISGDFFVCRTEGSDFASVKREDTVLVLRLVIPAASL